MTKTVLNIIGDNFYINGKKTYTEIEGSKTEAHGLLMNARFIQGIFDDKEDIKRFTRFGREFNPDRNTEALISALPEWYSYGLRAFTVGFQGGGPCFTIRNDTIHNNPFGEDGKYLDPAYTVRMDKLIRAADERGIVVIVSFFYPGQATRFSDGRAVANAVRTASRFLKEGGYTNVIIEICNEHNLVRAHPIIQSPEGMALLMDIARSESGGMPVGSSGAGKYISKEVSEVSDIILIHGNDCTRQQLYERILQVREWAPEKPVICNEDSQAISQLEVAFKTHTSWGYYNNATKQEPPVDWSVLKGEDKFFAYRMAEGIGIKPPPITKEEQYYFQGFEPNADFEGKRWIRLASLYPETINYVDYYRNDKLYYTCYDDPFTIHFKSNWKQGPVVIQPDDREWKAVIHLRNGEVIEKKAFTKC